MSAENIETLILLMSFAFTGCAAALAYYAKKGAKYLGELVGVEKTKEHDELIEGAVRRSVAYAEEQTSKYLRGLVDDGPQTGKEKLQVAKDAARSIAPQALAKVADDQLELLIEAEVQEVKRSTSIAPPPMFRTGSSMRPPAPAPGSSPAMPDMTAPAPVIDRLDASTTQRQRPVTKRGEP